MISATSPSVGRKQVNFEAMPGRFPDGTKARIERAKAPGESSSDFLRAAVENELQRREKPQH
jgi:hypothetical protein